MTSYLGSSRAECGICGAAKTLSSEPVAASAELATFAAAHSGHDRFVVDVIVQPTAAAH